MDSPSRATNTLKYPRQTPLASDLKQSTWPGATPQVTKEPLGFPLVLILSYLVFEYARPANPMGIPMVISILLFISWLNVPDKKWNPQIKCFLLLLGAIAVMGPFAMNNFAIWIGFQMMTVQLLCICIPIIHFVRSLRKITIFINALILVYLYVAMWGLLNGGTGPGGHISDENDLALAVNMAIPFAFASIFLAKTFWQTMLFSGAFAAMVACVIATFSRGGALGLATVLLYCILLSSKKKLQTFVIALLLGAGIWLLTPGAYWGEMASIQESTVQQDDASGELRWEYWALAVRMFKANPVFGVGLENFGFNAADYMTEEQVQRFGRMFASVAHSLYFTVLAELGTLGSLIFGALIFYNFRDLRGLLRSGETHNTSQRSSPSLPSAGREAKVSADIHRIRLYSHAARASLLGFMVAGAFLSVFEYPHFWILTAIIVTLKEISINRPNTSEQTNLQQTMASSFS